MNLYEMTESLTNAYQQLSRLKEAVISSEKMAQEAKRAKDIFVANVSHELRTPLNMIIGFSEMIMQSPKSYGRRLPSTLLADIRTIYYNAGHLSKLVDDVLDLGRLDAQYFKLSFAPCSVGVLFEEAAQTVRGLFEKKGLYLRIEVDPNLGDVECDKQRISQVLLNLLSNAGRFVEVGGITLEARHKDSKVIVTVRDTGPGIPEHERERIFEPFYQLKTPYHERKGGSGLGLTISKRLIEMHQGQMWLDASVTAGAAFCFSLPLHAYQPATSNWKRGDFAEGYMPNPHLRKVDIPPLKPRVVFVSPQPSLYAYAGKYWQDVDLAQHDNHDAASADLSKSPANAVVFTSLGSDDGMIGRAFKDMPFNMVTFICSLAEQQTGVPQTGIIKHLMKPISRSALLDAIAAISSPIHTILIADDDPECLQLLGRMLETSDTHYRILRADNGNRALELIRTGEPDLILLDLIMPGLSGFEILSALQKEPLKKDVPIILVSAQDVAGEPVTTDRLTVVYPGGFTTRMLLDTIRGVSEILEPAWRSEYSEQSENLPG